MLYKKKRYASIRRGAQVIAVHRMKYTFAFQGYLQGALEAILNTPNLSNDVFEVVSKSLKG